MATKEVERGQTSVCVRVRREGRWGSEASERPIRAVARRLHPSRRRRRDSGSRRSLAQAGPRARPPTDSFVFSEKEEIHGRK